MGASRWDRIQGIFARIDEQTQGAAACHRDPELLTRQSSRGRKLPVVEPETRYARVGEAYVGYQVFGAGPLDVVFIPAWNSNVDVMWEDPWLARFLRRLGSFARVITFDKRGTGISDPVPMAALPTLEQWADDVIAVMDATGSKRAALITHAEGGPMTMLFAASHPERISALVLMETFARLQRAPDYPHGIRPDQVERFLQQFVERWGTGVNVDQIAPGRAGDAHFRRWYGRYERIGLVPWDAESGVQLGRARGRPAPPPLDDPRPDPRPAQPGKPPRACRARRVPRRHTSPARNTSSFPATITSSTPATWTAASTRSRSS